MIMMMMMMVIMMMMMTMCLCVHICTNDEHPVHPVIFFAHLACADRFDWAKKQGAGKTFLFSPQARTILHTKALNGRDKGKQVSLLQAHKIPDHIYSWKAQIYNKVDG